MKRRILMIAVLLLVASASVVFAVDCRILGRERTGVDTMEVTVNFDPIQGGQLLAEGKQGPDLNDLWGELPIRIENGRGIVTTKGREGGYVFFTYYTVDGKRKSIDPQCSEYVWPKDAPPEKQYFRVPFGGKFTPKYIPAINMLLMKSEKITPPPPPPPPPPSIHNCPIVDSGVEYVNGVKVSWAKVSLQRFVGAIPEVLAATIPYVDGQSAPGDSWTGFQPVERQGDVAVIREVNWPGGNKEFSIKLMANGGTFWQNLPSWLVTCGNDHIVFKADGVTPDHLYVYLQ